jgi:myosin-light-chain kinase
VDGGELFDRIIDENYTLMELDTVLFIRQICEGLQHMHKMYILHLDLKVDYHTVFDRGGEQRNTYLMLQISVNVPVVIVFHSH